ncbi:reverse transcriptase domain-containing protein, partial [Tanacetum coccineum]
MDRFKSESSHIKGVPPVLRISAFMHGHGHPKLAKKLNDKIPKTVDEMFERVRAFIRGEVVTGSAEIVRPSQRDKGYIRPSWFGGPEKARNRGGQRETRRNMGIYTPYPRKDTFTPLIKTPKEILAMERSQHQRLLSVKKANRGSCGLGEVSPSGERYPQNNQKNESQGRNMIREGGNRKRPFEEERFGLTDELTFPAIPQNQLTDEPIILEGVIAGKQKMQSSAGRFLKRNVSSSRNNRPSSNYRKGRKKQNGANGVRDNKMSFAIQCHNMKDRNKKPQSGREVQWGQREEQMSRIIEQVILRTKSSFSRGPNPGLMPLEKIGGGENTEKVFTISHERLNQYVTMGTTLTTDCKWLLTNVLWENMEVFAWTGSERTAVPRFVMEHQLKIYPLSRPVVHKRRPMTPDGRLVLKEKVLRWLKEGMIRKSQQSLCQGHVPLSGGRGRASIDNGRPIQMFPMTPEGIQPKLKNSAATLWRIMEKVLVDQRGWNVEIYLEEIVIKNKNEQDLVQDMEETLRKLKRVNIRLIRSRPRSKAEVPYSQGLNEVRDSRRIWLDERSQRIPLKDKNEIEQIVNIGYSKEVEGSVIRKFFGQGEQVERIPDPNEEGTLNLSKKLHAKSTLTPRAWRLYLGKEAIEEGLGVRIILVSPEEKMYSFVIRLKFKAPNYAMDCEALLAGLAASANQGVKDLHVFIDSLTLVTQVEGNHTPSTEKERKYKEGIMDVTVPFY